MISTVLLVVLTISSSLSLTAAQTCYDRDGVVATNGYGENGGKRWRACPDSSTCCLDGGDSCFTGGYCYSGSGASFYRGMCTSSNWNEEGADCPTQCLDLRNADGNTWISHCGGNWCCAGWAGTGNDCCNNDSLTFQHPTLSPAVGAAVETETVTSVNTNPSPTAQDSTETEGNAAGATVTVTPTDIGHEGYVKQSVAIGVGAGLGIPLLIALGTIGFLLLMMRSRKSTNTETTPGQRFAEAPEETKLPPSGYDFPNQQNGHAGFGVGYLASSQDSKTTSSSSPGMQASGYAANAYAHSGTASPPVEGQQHGRPVVAEMDGSHRTHEL